MVRRFISVLCIFIPLIACAQTGTEQGTFDDKVRTLQVRSLTDRLTTGTPVIVLNSNDALTIEFDILADDRDYLRYELTHCNADWQPSGLNYVEYLDGFNEGTIDDYAFSHGTGVHYVHYVLTLPNEDMRLRLSGNYMVRIYREDNPDTTLVQARFCVSEESVGIGVAVTGRTDVDYNRSHQQLEIVVDCDNAPVRDLFNDLTVRIEQNGRQDNIAALRQPLRVSGRKVVYEHQQPLIFKAGNEYRRFETVSNLWNGMGVDHVEWHAPYYHHVLELDKPRSATGYLYDRTQRGGFTVHEYNASDPATEADYVVVHFTLEMPQLPGVDIYIDSDATHRALTEASRMQYNPETNLYHKALLLKQGQYAYQYLTVKRGEATGRTSEVEGDRYQTDNQYTIYVYTHVPGERYDRLIGHATIFAQQ